MRTSAPSRTLPNAATAATAATAASAVPISIALAVEHTGLYADSSSTNAPRCNATGAVCNTCSSIWEVYFDAIERTFHARARLARHARRGIELLKYCAGDYTVWPCWHSCRARSTRALCLGCFIDGASASASPDEHAQ